MHENIEPIEKQVKRQTSAFIDRVIAVKEAELQLYKNKQKTLFFSLLYSKAKKTQLINSILILETEIEAKKQYAKTLTQPERL